MAQPATPPRTAGDCLSNEHACPCLGGSYCFFRGASCLDPNSACPTDVEGTPAVGSSVDQAVVSVAAPAVATAPPAAVTAPSFQFPAFSGATAPAVALPQFNSGTFAQWPTLGTPVTQPFFGTPVTKPFGTPLQPFGTPLQPFGTPLQPFGTPLSQPFGTVSQPFLHLPAATAQPIVQPFAPFVAQPTILPAQGQFATGFGTFQPATTQFGVVAQPQILRQPQVVQG